MGLLQVSPQVDSSHSECPQKTGCGYTKDDGGKQGALCGVQLYTVLGAQGEEFLDRHKMAIDGRRIEDYFV